MEMEWPAILYESQKGERRFLSQKISTINYFALCKKRLEGGKHIKEFELIIW
jgi:hypothetical protein